MTASHTSDPTSTVSASPRSLSDTEFVDIYDCDRFTATVLTSRFRYIVKHMCTTLMTNAFSPVLRVSYDFAATLSGPPDLGYPMSAVADSLLLFTGTMADAVRNVVEEYRPEELRPRDILICNDPYRKGTHVNDVCFIRPVFFDGGLVAFIALNAHLMDMGGTVPGGFAATKRNVYENGLVIPPQLLYSEGRLVRSTLSLVFDNTRFGEQTLPDIRSIATALALGERLLCETLERYGRTAYRGALRYATDLGASAVRDALTRLPDGTYFGEDVLDCDGLDASVGYLIRVKVSKVGGRAEVDLSGSSRQARTCINAGWLDTKTAVSVAMKFLLDPATPYTSGACRDIDIVLPSGTIVSATPPDGAIFSYWEATMPLVHALLRALSDAVGSDAIAGDFCSAMTHHATGLLPDGAPWAVVGGTCGGEIGPSGATRSGDGENSLWIMLANGIAPSVEGTEAEAPMVLLQKEYVIDSCGAGMFRGGAATRKDSLWLTATEYHTTNLHTRYPSGFGVRGGGEGSRPGVWQWDAEEGTRAGFIPNGPAAYATSTPILGVFDPDTFVLDAVDGTYFHFGRKPVWETEPNAVLRYQTGGGGGWGDPLERDPELVRRDVRDEYVSLEAAASEYGVVIEGDPIADPEGVCISRERTETLRDQLRGERDERSRRTEGEADAAARLPGAATVPGNAAPYVAAEHPVAPSLYVEKEFVPGKCPECGASALYRYPVIAELGWQMVVKCECCLHATERTRWNRLGAIELLIDRIPYD